MYWSEFKIKGVDKKKVYPERIRFFDILFIVSQFNWLRTKSNIKKPKMTKKHRVKISME